MSHLKADKMYVSLISLWESTTSNRFLYCWATKQSCCATDLTNDLQELPQCEKHHQDLWEQLIPACNLSVTGPGKHSREQFPATGFKQDSNRNRSWLAAGELFLSARGFLWGQTITERLPDLQTCTAVYCICLLNELNWPCIYFGIRSCLRD